MKGLRPLLALAAALGSASSHAQSEYTWTGSGSDPFWATAGNWAGGTTPPISASTWLVFTGSTFSASTNNISNPFGLNALTFKELTGDFQISSRLDFVPNGTMPPLIEQNGNYAATLIGTINASPSLTISGTGTGDLRLLTTYETSPGEQLTIARNNGSLTVLNGGLFNSGTTSLVSGDLRVRGTINSGVITVGSGGRLIFSDTDAFTYQLAAGSSLLGDVGSTIALQGVTLYVSSPSVNFSTAGNLNFAGGTITGASNFDLSVGSTFRWSAGDIEGNTGNATTIFLGNGIIEGANTKNIGRVLTFRSGQLAWNEGDLHLTSDGALSIDHTIVTVSDSAGNLTNSGTGRVIFTSATLQQFSGTSVTRLDAGVVADATTTFLFNSGGVHFANSGSYASQFHLQDATARFSGGLHVLGIGATVFGSGTASVHVSSGTLNINANNVLQSGLILDPDSELGGTASSITLNSFAPFHWKGGTITGASGHTMTGSQLTVISGTDAKILDRRSLTLPSGTWSGGDLTLTNEANLTLNALTIASDNTLARTGTMSRLAISGVVEKTGPTGTTTVALPVLNSGTIRATNGTIRLTGGGTSHGQFQTGSPTAVLDFAGGTFNLSATTPVTALTSGGTMRISSGRVNLNAVGANFGQNMSLLLSDVGTLNGGSNATFSGTRFDWTGGTIAGWLYSNVLTISGNATKNLDTASFSFTGGQWTGGDISLANGSTLSNFNLFSVTTDNAITRTGPTGGYINSGFFNKTTTTGTTAIGVALTNSGTIRAGSGTILLTAGGTSSGLISAASAGTIEFGGGIYQLFGSDPLLGFNTGTSWSKFRISNGQVNINTATTLNLNSALILGESGTLGGLSSGYTINGVVFDWTGGVIAGSANSTLTVGSTLNISGTATKTLNQRSLTLTSGVWGAGDIALTNNSNLSVAGSLQVLSDYALTRTGTLSQLVNSGVLYKTTTSGTTSLDLPILNSGTIRAHTGTIFLTGGGTSSGAFTAGPSGTMEFGGGTYQLYGETPLVGAYSGTTWSTFRISSGQVAINQASTVALNSGLALTVGGTLGGASQDILLNGIVFDWTGGVITGNAGSTLTAQLGTYLSGTATKTLDRRSLHLAYGAQWTGGDIVLATNSTLVNSGVMESLADTSIIRTGTLSRLVNNGLINKSIGTGTTTLAVPVLNSGTIRASSGTVVLTGGGTSNGYFFAGPQGVIEFAGGTFEMNSESAMAGSFNGMNASAIRITSGQVNFNYASASPIATGARLFLSEGGTLGGIASHYVIGSNRFDWIGGTITGANGSTGTVNGSVLLSGTATKTIDRRSLTLASSQWSDGEIALTNNGSLTVSGSLGVTAESSLTSTGTLGRLTVEGVLNKTNSGTTTLAAPIHNVGTIRADRGTLILAGGGTYIGLLSTGSAATIQFDGGTHQIFGNNLHADVVGTNYGTFVIKSGKVELSTPGSTVNNGRLILKESGILGTRSGNFSIGGLFDWTGGVITGTSFSTATLLNPATISGTSAKTLDRLTLSLSGDWTGGDITITNGGILSTDFLTATSDHALSGTSGRLVVNNLLLKNGTSGTTTIGAAIQSGGNIRAQTGTILLTGGGTSNGQFLTEAGTTIEFGGGTFSLFNTNALASLSNAGSYRISGGQIVAENHLAIGASGMNFTMTGGTVLSKFGLFINTSNFLWQGGGFSGSNGIIQVAPSAIISGTALKTIDRARLSLSGTWSGGDIAILNGGTLNVGNFAIMSDNTLSSQSLSDRLIVSGSLTKSASTGTTTLAPFLQSGTTGISSVTASTGTILMTGGSGTGIAFSTQPGGTIDFGGGLFTLSGTNPFGNSSGAGGNFVISSGTVFLTESNVVANQNSTLTLGPAGVLTGSTANLTLAGSLFHWSGGTIGGIAGSSATVSAATTISGTSTKTLDARSLSLSQTGAWTGGDIVLANDAALTVGNVNVQADSTITRTGPSGGLTLSGGFTKSASSGTTILAVPLTMTASGSLTAGSGRILLTGGGTSAGVFRVANSGSIEFGGGTFDLSASNALGTSGPSAAAEILVTGGRVNLNAPSTAIGFGVKLTLSDGTLGGSATNISFSGSSFQWLGGTIAGALGSTLTSSIPIAISGMSTKTLDGRRLNLSGTWSGGDIVLANSATLNITGTTTITSANTLTRSGASGGISLSGILQKTSSGTTSIDAPLTFTGGSGIQALNGTLALSGGAAVSAGVLFVTGSGGTLELGSGTYSFTTGATVQGSGGDFVINGADVTANVFGMTIGAGSNVTLKAGSLGGTAPSFTLAGSSFRWEGGTITGGAGSTIAVSAPTVLSGTTKYLDTRSGTLSGSWTGGDIVLNDTTLGLTNLTVQSDAKITRAASTGSLLIGGNFTKNTTTGTTTIDTGFRNSGAISIQSGVLQFTQTGTNAGSIIIGNGGTMDVDATLLGAGTMNVQAGGKLTGSGTIQGAVTVSGTLAPGNSPGTMAFQSTLLMDDNSTYAFELGAYEDDGSGGLAGTDWDLLAFSGNAGLVFDVGSKIFLDFAGIDNPDTPGAFWDEETDRRWLIADLASGTLSYSHLSVANATWETGTFSLTNVGNDLYLQFTAVPEPSGVALILFGIGLAIRRRKRPGSTQ